jgi:hypothetical protein
MEESAHYLRELDKEIHRADRLNSPKLRAEADSA